MMNPNQKFWYLLIYTVIEKTDFPGGASCKESVCEILQARILELVAFPFSRASFQPWD